MRFGRYRQLNGANNFATERQFLHAEKAIRVKSLIKFSDYSIKDVQAIMKKDTLVCESTVQSHADFIIDCISECIEISCSDANIVFYIAGFIAKSLTKKFKCKGCINVLGRTEDVLMPELENIPENCQYFIDMKYWSNQTNRYYILNVYCFLGAL